MTPYFVETEEITSHAGVVQPGLAQPGLAERAVVAKGALQLKWLRAICLVGIQVAGVCLAVRSLKHTLRQSSRSGQSDRGESLGSGPTNTISRL